MKCSLLLSFETPLNAQILTKLVFISTVSSIVMSARSDTEYDDQIQTVRDKFFEQLKSNPTLIGTIDAEDIAKINKCDWFVRRWLLHNNGNLDPSVEQLITAVQWRHEMGFRRLAPNYFPNEMYRVGGLFFYEPTQDGQPTLYLRLARVKKIPEVNELVKKFVSYMLWQLDERADGHGFVIVFDFLGAGLSNCDLDIAKHLISTLTRHFSMGMANAYAVDFPWILRAFWAMVKNMVPASRRSLLKFCSRAELLSHIDGDRLPTSLGGSCQSPTTGWAVAPQGSPSCVEFGVNVLGIPRERCEKLFEVFIPMLEPDDDPKAIHKC